MANDYKSTYLPVAQDAAKKYGVADIEGFINNIGNSSGWNPYNVTKLGSGGIASLSPDQADALNVNPFDPVAALDAAARLWASIEKTNSAYNNVLGTANVYGVANIPQDAQDVQNVLISGDKLIDPKKPNEAPPENSKAGFLNDPVAYLQQALVNIGTPLLFGSIGVMLIILSVYIVVMKNKGF